MLSQTVVKPQIVERYCVSYCDNKNHLHSHYVNSVKQMLKVKLEAKAKGYDSNVIKITESYGEKVVTQVSL